MRQHEYAFKCARNGDKKKGYEAVHRLFAEPNWTYSYHVVGIFKTNAQKVLMDIVESELIILFDALNFKIHGNDGFMITRTEDVVQYHEPLRNGIHHTVDCPQLHVPWE